MPIHNPFEVTYGLLAVAALGAIAIAALTAAMHVKHKSYPGLIGALVGALLCFLLIEALPALT
ncbi:hypothetical protein [Burkholderia guangdongensis]|uniref:hypothetical protein n=1 Tax=Burkholderia guangdongensis TaxID=1792500 RepID=UPI0015CDE09B|nr:hypothetical protein [Burkholderia guangdongensis]